MIKTRVTKLTITPAELFPERGFSVEIVDEAGGEFVEVRSNESGSPLRIDVDEWPFLRDAIDRMFVEIAENECGGGEGKQAPPAETSEASGWIPWNGGECPVDDEVRVSVRFRDSSDYDEWPVKAGTLRWSNLGNAADIVAYKVGG